MHNLRQRQAQRPREGSPASALPGAFRTFIPTLSTGDARAVLLQEIRQRRQQTMRQVRGLRRTYSRLTYGGVICSALATLIAGWAAASGPIVGEGFPAWQATCGVVAVFTATSGVLGGVQQGSQVTDRLSKLMAHAAKLNGLEVALTLRNRDPDEVAREYEALVAENVEPDL